MPQLLRRNLPPVLYEHLLERIQQRSIPSTDLVLMIEWLDGKPKVPSGRWFKKFPGLVVRGEGELVKTFLLAG